jgi:hypothetical protein
VTVGRPAPVIFTVTITARLRCLFRSANPRLVSLIFSAALAPLASVRRPLPIATGGLVLFLAAPARTTLAAEALAAGTAAVTVTVHGLDVALEQLACSGSVTDGPVADTVLLPCGATVVVAAPFEVVVVVEAGAGAGAPALMAASTENSLVTPGPAAGTVVAVDETKR